MGHSDGTTTYESAEELPANTEAGEDAVEDLLVDGLETDLVPASK